VLAFIRRHPLHAIVAVGVAVRVALAFATVGSTADIAAWRAVAEAVEDDPLRPYLVNDSWEGGTAIPAWPYLPAYLPWLVAALGLHNLLALPFHGIVQLAPIAADVGIAVAIYIYLGWRRAAARLRLAGAALVMLGPSFIAISGYQGQIDSVAILPAVLALMAWERRGAATRARDSGVLIGIGVAIKTVPGLVVLALLPAARSARERLWLIGAAVAVPVAVSIPFAVADPGGFESAIGYGGVPGRGGLSLVVQPSVMWDLLTGGVLEPHPTELREAVADSARWVTIAVLAAMAVFLFRYRPRPVDGAVLLWLAIYVFVPNFLIQYLVWGLPFFIMAGYLRETAILQLALVPATVITYQVSPTGGVDEGLATLYVATMIALWAFWVVAFSTLAARVMRRAGDNRGGVQPPLVRLAGT
jgi:hypothetical protein